MPADKSQKVIADAGRQYERLGLFWTGGKDSTVLLHLVQKALAEMCPVIFVNTQVHFPDTLDFVAAEADRLGLDLHSVTRTEFAHRPMSCQWCSQFKTLAMHDAIERLRLDAVFVGIRWDESPARADETYVSRRDYPDYPEASHVRIHPLLHWSMQDIFDHIDREELPVNPLYDEGYTSIGCEPCTNPSPDDSERGGRGQDKEQVMERLRSWR